MNGCAKVYGFYACFRIASVMAAMARLSRIWRNNTISFASKFKLYKSLVTFILLCGCETWTLLAGFGKKGSKLSNPSGWGNFFTFPIWSTGPTTECRARSVLLWVHRNLFWQLSREKNLHGLGMSHVMTASPKPSFSVPWRMGDAVVSRGNAGWTTSISACARTAHKGLLQKRQKQWKRISAESSLMFPQKPSWSMNWTELIPVSLYSCFV